MSTQIETLKKRLSLGSLPESAKAAIRKQIEQLEAAEKGTQESATKQQEKLEKEEEGKEAEVDDKLEKLKKRLTLGSLPESAKAAIRKQIEDAEKLKTEAKKERAEEKKEAEEKKKEVKAKVEKAVKEVEKVVKEAPKKIEKAPATEKKAVEKRVEKEVKQKVEKAKTEAKKAEVEAKKADAKKSEGAKKRKKKFDKMLSDLQRFINKDKKLKALYGSDSKEDLKRDAGRMAKPFGWRYKGEHNYKVPPKSERGNDNTYYEARPEKSDLRRRTYPYLEMGGDIMADGGEISNIKMYYHKTSGGAEYLCSEKVAGTKEGSMKAKYVVRIDGAKNGSEMIIKPTYGNYTNVSMYYHKTSGGAEYLCSENVAGTNEGSMKAKYVCRIDGAKNGSEMMARIWERVKVGNPKRKMADGGMMAKGGDTRGEFGTFLIEIFENGVLRKEKIVRGGYKNLVEEMAKEEAKSYKKPVVNVRKIMSDGGMMADGGDTRGEFGTFLIEIFENGVLRKEKIVRGGYKNLVEEMAKEEAKSYKKPVVNVRKIMSDTTHVAFNLMDKNEYSVVGWMSEEDRDMGESEGLGMYDSLEEAKRKADVAFYRQGYAAVEVLRLSQQGDEDDEVVYFVEEGSEEFAKGGLFGNSRYNTGRSWKLDRARHNKKEDYEIPMENRKGASKSAPAKSGAKRAKTGKYAKSSRAASSSSRGYDYIPNAKIKSITTTDGKVITSKKVLDGAYVRKKNGGMM